MLYGAERSGTRVLKQAYVAAILAAGLAVSLPGSYAQARPAADPGVTGDSILIGGTTPLTGVAAAYASVALGAKAYFDYVNARGGVNRRKIRYKYLDDAYEPTQTAQKTRQLVQQDRVFAIFNSLGTEHNQAVRGFLNEAEIPQLFVASGATTWGRDYKDYPWTMGYQPTYIAEGVMYARHLLRTKPRARIAILYQDDDFGRDMIAGLRRGLGRRANQIVARESYDVSDSDVRSQITQLRSSRANTLMLFATPKFTIQAYQYVNQLGWKPLIVVNAVSSASNVMQLASSNGRNRRVNGSVSIVFLKDPNDPKWRNDRGIKLYRSILRRYGRGSNPKDVYNVYGMSAAHTFVAALRKAGRNVSRRSLMTAATRLTVRNDPFLLPGITVRTTPSRRYPLSQAKLQRWQGGRWVSFGALQRANS